MPKQTIDISTNIVFRTLLILAVIWFLYLVLDILALLFISVIIVSAMNPVIDYLQRKKIPRTTSVLSLYILLIIILGIFVYFLIPPIISQSQDFITKAPEYFNGLESFLAKLRGTFEQEHINIDVQNVQDQITGILSSLPRNIFSTTVGFFSGFISFIVVLSLVFYMSIEEDGIKKFIVSLTPEMHKKYAANLTKRIEDKIGKWMLGQVLLMFLIFVITSLGLYLAGVPYALILGAFAGIMEIIPYVGPIISAVPGVILGFLVSPTVGFLALLVYLVSQQIENHVIVPQIMKKAVGLNPVAVIIALLIGAKLGGALGAILSIPVATAISLFVSDLMEKKEM